MKLMHADARHACFYVYLLYTCCECPTLAGRLYVSCPAVRIFARCGGVLPFTRAHIHNMLASSTVPSRAPAWPDETALDLFTRLAYPGLELLPFSAQELKIGETLEVLGEPATGKSALLMECCVRCVLPNEYGGHAARAVVVDTGSGFNLHRLGAMLSGRLAAAGVTHEVTRTVVATSLRRLRVMTCPSPSEALIGLEALRCELEASQSGAERPRLLLIDSVSAFQWLERAAQARGGGSSCTATSFDARLNRLLALLRRQRLSIVWSRSPAKGHNLGLEFPILEHGTSALAELNQPSLRLRLRSIEGALVPPACMGAQHVFQVLLDVAPAMVSSAGAGPVSAQAPPLRRDLCVWPEGVRCGGE